MGPKINRFHIFPPCFRMYFEQNANQTQTQRKKIPPQQLQVCPNWLIIGIMRPFLHCWFSSSMLLVLLLLLLFQWEFQDPNMEEASLKKNIPLRTCQYSVAGVHHSCLCGFVDPLWGTHSSFICGGNPMADKTMVMSLVLKQHQCTWNFPMGIPHQPLCLASTKVLTLLKVIQPWLSPTCLRIWIHHQGETHSCKLVYKSIIDYNYSPHNKNHRIHQAMST